jgi:hypothetical protein
MPLAATMTLNISTNNSALIVEIHIKKTTLHFYVKSSIQIECLPDFRFIWR